MKLQQLRLVREAVRQNYNLTEVARVLFTSQPGVSKAIIELEQELGVDIFTRHGKRIQGLSVPGRLVLTSAELVMQELDGLRRIVKEFSEHDTGDFTIATTHTQARYALPKAVHAFTQKFPKVRLSLLQGNPKQVAEMVLKDQADLAIATEGIGNREGLISLPCYQWEHVVVVLPGHPLLKSEPISLEDLAAYPLITYDSAFTGRANIDRAFSLHHLKPDILLEAMDADVIKTYVELGMGVGIIASMAFDAERDKTLRSIAAGHLFGTNVSHVATKKGAYLRSYVYAFIELFAPTLDYKLARKAVSFNRNNMYVHEVPGDHG